MVRRSNKQNNRQNLTQQNIPSDKRHKSPFFAKEGEKKKYLTFEPDQGGVNNIRMSMETVMALAYAMGRVLVLPPEVCTIYWEQNVAGLWLLCLRRP